MKKTLKILIIACVLFGGFFALNHFQNCNKEAYISITFDDGYLSQYRAADILESYGYKGTFYVPAGLMGKEFENRQLMDWSQLKALQEKGHEIGGHTLNHVHAKDMSEKDYDAEVLEGKNLLLQHGISATDFAYPYGDDAYKQSEKYFKTARTTKWCVNKISANELCGLALVRINYKLLPVYLSDLKTNGGWLVIVIHSIDENPRPDVDVTSEQLISILEQIKNSGIPVKTIAEVANG